MNALGRWLLAIAALASAACGTLAAQEQPAVIAAPTERSRAELLRILSAAANGQPITLADDALTRVSVVTLERRTPAGPQGRAATGRTLDAPEQFRLVLRGSRCLLVRQSDGSEWELEEAQCAPAALGVQ